MTDRETIKDYGTTVSPEVYMSALQGHQYIPQADRAILNVVREHVKGNLNAAILDLGCGPGRLTCAIAQENDAKVFGIDVSESFIKYARHERRHEYGHMPGRILFQQTDFASGEDIVDFNGKAYDKGFDAIIMQGVMHHVHGEERTTFLKRCYGLLKPGGILVIGDEFIKNYLSETERVAYVCQFYLHIIGEARKGGFIELAKEEAKNLIDDVFAGSELAGRGTDEIFEFIYEYAEVINDYFYKGSHILMKTHTDHVVKELRKKLESLSGAQLENFNRGDYKTSVSRFVKEVSDSCPWKLGPILKIGPVEQLGGMAVITFAK